MASVCLSVGLEVPQKNEENKRKHKIAIFYFPGTIDNMTVGENQESYRIPHCSNDRKKIGSPLFHQNTYRKLWNKKKIQAKASIYSPNDKYTSTVKPG